jgi:hypothetical protein
MTPEMAALTKSEGETESTAEEREAKRAALAWTQESRLEQVNVECCPQLTLATMTRIKELVAERQANLERQGRKKTRIWIENAHDMMMTRLAMERGSELPPERLVTNVITTPSSSSSSSESSSNTDSNDANATTETTLGEGVLSAIPAPAPVPVSAESFSSETLSAAQNQPQPQPQPQDQPHELMIVTETQVTA